MFNSYLKKIAETTFQGDAREESYYGHFSNLLIEYAEQTKKKDIQVTTLPRKTEGGNPDFRVWDGKQHIIGYIEAKKPGENLDYIEDSEQLKRYRSTFPNLILTDFYEFRLYRNGELIDKVLIARPFIAKKLKTIPPLEKEEKFISILEKFFAFSLPKVYSAENLAIELAKRTGFLRDEIISKELEEEELGKGRILGFYKAFTEYLVSNLAQKEFADIYAQTITYGLFAARTKATNGFTRKNAYDLIPPTIGILRDIFQFISLGTVPTHMEVMIDDIAEVLQVADVNKILQDYYRKGKGEDPIVHFYETFLNIYDPTTREKRGVYYTPEPVVKYIVHSTHDILKSHFSLTDGLASKDVTLLDPAGGTLTFPAEAIKLAVREFTAKYGDGGKKKFIRNQLLKNFFSFELMMAPYAIGHIKISFLLEELGYTLQDDDRFKLYLTNTLDMEDLQQTEIPGLGSLSDESHLAAQVKSDEPILVIVGNPPYSGISANINDWTEKLLKENIDGAQSYYEIDGEPLGEKKLWLQDDYVKFLRFAQWKIHKAGQGIVGMITNHSYLDNPTFRGMRQSLMNTFNEIYLLDLHGNALKKETTPEGGKDENVFDIRQGVSIAILIKERNKKGSKIYHTDLFGLRSEKYNWLEKHNFKSKNYTLIKPVSPWYFFIPRYTKGIESFNDWPRIIDIFPFNVTGIVTARDSFVIDFEEHSIRNRIIQFRNLKQEDEIIRAAYKLKDTRGWKLGEARKKLAKDENWNSYFRDILYRPFDKRKIYYTPKMVDWGRPKYMKHLLEIDGNTGLCFMRQYSGNTGYNHALVSDCMIDNRTFFSSKGIIQLAPLYVLPENEDGNNGDLFNPASNDPKPNIAENIYKTLKENYGNGLKPEQILNYIYAILYSNIYREKYSEYLNFDFPRIPFPKEFQLFGQFSKLGKELVNLHLLKHSALNKPISKYNGVGDNDRIQKPTYSQEEKRIYINEYKYFDNVKTEVWNYYLGGYQVLDKFLKDRKGIDMKDPSMYCKIITSISKTIEIQSKIDLLFTRFEDKSTTIINLCKHI